MLVLSQQLFARSTLFTLGGEMVTAGAVSQDKVSTLLSRVLKAHHRQYLDGPVIFLYLSQLAGEPVGLVCT
tara:strand:- start:328 stop:540 length:213 start_codon:yes stop_codon:yes gene_type:complete